MRISNSVNSLVAVEPLESSAEPTSLASTTESSTDEKSQAELGVGAPSSPNLPKRPIDDPLSKAFLLQKLDAAVSQPSALSISTEGPFKDTVITDPAVGGEDNQKAEDKESELTAQLAQELANAGISCDPDNLSKVSNAITKGGEGAMAVAFMLTNSISESQVEQPSEVETTPGDPTQGPVEGNASSTPQDQISQMQADQFTAAPSSGNDSSSQLSQLLLTELNRRKKK